MKGDLGTIRVAHTGEVAPIKKVNYNKISGVVTLTVSPLQAYVNEGLEQFGDLLPTEDITHEEVKPKQTNNGK